MLTSRGTSGGNSTQTHSWGRSPAAVPHDKLWHRFHRDRERHTRRRKTIAKRRNNGAKFERTLLPVLSALFENMFSDHPDQDDAIQDCLCQAWLAYCALPADAADAVTAGQLAARIYRQYRAGGRFTALAG